MTAWVEAWGLPGLFLAAFLAATVLPFSSEAALVGALAAGVPVGPALVVASVGNTLACALNYGLGWWLGERMRPRLESSRGGRAALRWSERWGAWALLASWLPVVGDPLTIVAGLARVRPWLFAVIVPALRVARYVAIAGLV